MKLRHRALLVLAPAFGLLGLSAGTASAHVTVSAPDATQGGYAVISFLVPTESETASTTGIQIQLPTDTPIASISIEPVPGWSYTVKQTELKTPVTTDDGPVTEAIGEIDWAATGPGIAPGQFQEFRISAGPLPKVASLTFKVIQKYSDHSSVSWVEVAAPGSAEPEHPAPTLALAPAAGSEATSSPSATPTTASTTMNMAIDDQGYAKQSGVTTALIISAVAVLLAAGGFGAGFAAWRRTRP